MPCRIAEIDKDRVAIGGNTDKDLANCGSVGRAHLEVVDRGVDRALLQAHAQTQRRERAGLGRRFELPLQIFDVSGAELLGANWPSLAMAGHDQVGERHAVGGGEQSVVARLVDELVDQLLLLDALLGLAQRLALLGGLRKLDNFAVIVGRTGNHVLMLGRTITLNMHNMDEKRNTM